MCIIFLTKKIKVILGSENSYSGQDMKTAHSRMKITDEEFDIFMNHLSVSFQDFEINDADLDVLINIFEIFREDIVPK